MARLPSAGASRRGKATPAPDHGTEINAAGKEKRQTRKSRGTQARKPEFGSAASRETAGQVTSACRHAR